jgi:hypothetical protein
MYLTTEYTEKKKFISLAGWLITLLALVFGYNYIKDIISFVLIKLYEFFIQNTPSQDWINDL